MCVSQIIRNQPHGNSAENTASRCIVSAGLADQEYHFSHGDSRLAMTCAGGGNYLQGKKRGVESRVTSDLRFHGVERKLYVVCILCPKVPRRSFCAHLCPEATSIALRFTLGGIFALETCVFPRF